MGGKRGSEGTEQLRPPGAQGIGWGVGVARGLGLGLAGLHRGAHRFMPSWTNGFPPQR